VILVGTSGWQYRDWRERFYPMGLPQRSWLSFYASRFATTELNSSFYRLPEVSSFERWKAETPHGFVIAVKASRFLTHLKRLEDPEEAVTRLWSRTQALGRRLGPVLFQLPPSLQADHGRLAGLLACLPAGMRAAFEFRDRSWNSDRTYRMLDEAGAALVWADRPATAIRLPITSAWAYIRFHQGSPRTPGYPRRKLARWADRIADLQSEQTWIYFNNDTGGAAVRDATTLVSLLEDRGAPVVPPPVSKDAGTDGPVSPLEGRGKIRRGDRESPAFDELG